MANININSDQSIFDAVLQSSGAISALFDFMNANGLTSLDIPSGEYLAANVINPEVVNYLAENNPSTVLVTPQMASVIPIGYVSNSDGTFLIEVPGGDTVELDDVQVVVNINGVQANSFTAPAMADIIINVG